MGNLTLLPFFYLPSKGVVPVLHRVRTGGDVFGNAHYSPSACPRLRFSGRKLCGFSMSFTVTYLHIFYILTYRFSLFFVDYSIAVLELVRA